MAMSRSLTLGLAVLYMEKTGSFASKRKTVNVANRLRNILTT